MDLLWLHHLDNSIANSSICPVFQILSQSRRRNTDAAKKICSNGFAIPVAAFISTNTLTRIIGMGIPNLGFIATLFFSGIVGYAIVKYDLFTFDAALAAENILVTMPDSLILADVKGKILRVNDRLIDFVGYKQEELIGELITKLSAENQEKNCADIIKELTMKKIIRNHELILKSKFGTKLNVLFSGSIVQSKTGHSIGMACIIHDISERKKAEEELANNKYYLETVLNSMLSGIIVLDGNTHEIIDINNAALKLIGYSRDEVIGKVCNKFVCPAQVGKCPITDLGLTVDNQERMLLNANGNKIPIIKSVVKLEIKDRPLLIENFMDISERKKIEEKLVKSERLASIGELSGQIGHDLRNPLAAIKNGIYIIKKKDTQL